jgi:hypothetical protein
MIKQDVVRVPMVGCQSKHFTVVSGQYERNSNGYNLAKRI